MIRAKFRLIRGRKETRHPANRPGALIRRVFQGRSLRSLDDVVARSGDKLRLGHGVAEQVQAIAEPRRVDERAFDVLGLFGQQYDVVPCRGRCITFGLLIELFLGRDTGEVVRLGVERRAELSLSVFQVAIVPQHDRAESLQSFLLGAFVDQRYLLFPRALFRGFGKLDFEGRSRLLFGGNRFFRFRFRGSGFRRSVLLG